MAALAFAAAAAYLAPVGYASIGWAVGSMIGNALFPQQLPDQVSEGPRISDLKVLTSAYGQMVPIVAGTIQVAGNIIWAMPVTEHARTESQTQGGKGGGPEQTVTQTTYTYTADFAVLLCEGPIAGVSRIWANGELVYNVSTTATTETIVGSSLVATAIRVHLGTESQDVDHLIYADKGADTPGYRGYAYVVFEGLDVTANGGRPPQLQFEVVKEGALADLDVATTYTLGASDGSTAPVLGRGGNVWAGAVTSGGAANRWSFYSGAKLSTYTPATYTYIPAGLTASGEAIATGSFAGVLAVLHEDGSIDRYTGGAANMGSGGTLGILAEPDNDVWWCRGDSGSSTALYRVLVDHEALTLDDTALSGFYTAALARNGVAIAGRCYILGRYTPAGQAYIGFVSAQTLSFVPLVAITGFAGFLVTRAGTIWFGPNNSSSDRDELHQYSQDGTLLQTVVLPTVASAGWDVFEDASGLIWAVGLTGFGSNRRAYCVQPTTGDLLYTSEDFLGTPLGFTEDNRFVIWDTVTGNFVFKEVERLPRLTAAPGTVGDFIGELCERVGLSASDIDVSQLTDTLGGYALARRESVRSAIAPLQIAYAFDALESDNVIEFVQRGGAVVATIAEEDLAARVYGETPPAKVANVRMLETELPREVSVQYLDGNADYQTGAQYARRLTGASSEVMSIDLPLVLTSQQAERIAELVLYERWAGRNQQEIALSREYADLEPTDVISVESDGATYTVRITDVSAAGGLIKLRSVTEETVVYSPVSSGVSAPDPVTAVGVAGPTVLRVLDIPLLRDVDDGAGFYAAAAGYYTGWRGAELWRSSDAGVSYERTQVAFLTSSVMGAATTVLADFHGKNTFDEHSTVDVQVFGGELSSTTEADVLGGGNIAYIGGELVQFKNATLIGSGQYRLSGLLRGRRGTEQYMSTHAAGEQFVLLSASSTQRVGIPTADIGIQRLFKAPSFGQALSDAVTVDVTPAAVGLDPLSPVHLGGGRDASLNLTITWVRRTRIGGEWRDYVDAQLGEDSEAYEVEIWDSTFATLKRTVTGLTSATTTYSAANQVTDFVSAQATVYVRVYQVSAAAGRGFALQGSI